MYIIFQKKKKRKIKLFEKKNKDYEDNNYDFMSRHKMIQIFLYQKKQLYYYNYNYNKMIYMYYLLSFLL
jgi:hypothetical protein